MAPSDAAEAIRAVADQFVAGQATVRDVWSSFHANLHALCEFEPLDGAFLAMFVHLEAWERALPESKPQREVALRTVAERLASA